MDDLLDISSGYHHSPLTRTDDPLLPVFVHSSESQDSLFSCLHGVDSRDEDDKKSNSDWESVQDSLTDFFTQDVGPSQSWLDFYQSMQSGSIQEIVIPSEEEKSRHAPLVVGERKPYQRFRDKKFVCDECDRCFTLKQNVQHHIMHYHMKEKTLQIRSGRRFKCLKCDQVFRTLNQAQRHDLAKHSKLVTATKIWKCEECSKVYPTNAQLKEHITIHHKKEKPHICLECGARFGRRGGLRRHSLSVHGGRIHKCKFEGCHHPGYKCSKALAAHVRAVHTKERPFVCLLCERAFVRKNDLKTHELTHTASNRLKCEACVKEFKRHSSLSAHKRRCQFDVKKDEPTEEGAFDAPKPSTSAVDDQENETWQVKTEIFDEP